MQLKPLPFLTHGLFELQHVFPTFITELDAPNVDSLFGMIRDNADSAARILNCYAVRENEQRPTTLLALNVPQEPTREQSSRTQHYFTDILLKRQYRAYLGHLLSFIPGRWLEVLSKNAKFKFSNPEFQSALCYRLFFSPSCYLSSEYCTPQYKIVHSKNFYSICR